MRPLITTFILALAVPLVNSQQPSKPTHQTPTQQSVVANPGPSAEDAQAMLEDLQRMKSLVQQMQINLAFVTTIQGPLKHQFQLEVEMWQLQIASMERRLGSASAEEPRK